MWHSIKIGVFIGVTTSSLVVFFLRIIPMTPLIMIAILYLYAIVGGVTAYIVHKKVNNSSKTEHVVSQKVDNINSKKEVDSLLPKKELVNIIEYKQTLDKIKNLKRTSLLLKGLIETRKKIEELKKESNSILEDVVEKMDSKSLDLTGNYLEMS